MVKALKLLGWTLLAFITTGWVMNIVSLINTEAAATSGVTFVRAAGVIVVPLGGVMGWF
jgi:hypothetical protein